MTWNQAQYEANVSAGLVPEGLYLYGCSSDTMAEDATGRHLPGASGNVFADPEDDALVVWLGVDTESPYQDSVITCDERGVMPVFGAPVPVIWADFGDGFVAVKPWRAPMGADSVYEALQEHETADDPHGDRAYTQTYVAQQLATIPAANPAFGVTLDSFPGANYDEKFSNALSYAAAQTYKPTIILPKDSITLSAGPYNFFDGLKLSGPPPANEREFQTTGPQCIVNVSGAPLFKMPGGDVRNMSIRNIQFRTSAGVDWMVKETDFSAGPIMQDADFRDLAWVGFGSVMHVRHLRCSIERMYCNNGTGTQFKLGGSDNYYWTEGYSYLSGSLPAEKYYIYFTSMSRSTVGEIYITPQYATAVRVDTSRGNLVFRGTRFDCTGRNQSTACQGAAVFINGGQGYVFRDCWFFNNAVNPSATGRSDKGQVYVKSPAAEILFDGCQWGGGDIEPIATPPDTPAIYCRSGVSNVRVQNPLAPYGGVKLLQQEASGIISCNDPGWTINTSA